jgi:hopanoid biosynthesis associated protein HpnK
MEKRLIINADDFGLCAGVNRAIVEAHTHGVLTSTTLMANMPAALEAVQLAKSLPGLGVGVHLTLVEGRPLSKIDEVACLTNEAGEFAYSPGKLVVMSLVSGQVRRAIKAELSLQIQWVIDCGIKPTHLDSHKHVHAFPTLHPIICELAEYFGIPYIRNVYEPGYVCGAGWPAVQAGGKGRARKLRAMAKLSGLRNSRYFANNMLFGVAHTGTIDALFFKALAQCPWQGRAEVMTHPGYPEGLDAGKTRLIEERRRELEALVSGETKECMARAGIELVHYGKLLKENEKH